MSFAFDGPVARRATVGCGLLLAGAFASGCPSTGSGGSNSNSSGTVGATSTSTSTTSSGGDGGTGGEGGKNTTATTSTTSTTGTTGTTATTGAGGAGGHGGNGGNGGSPCEPEMCDDSDACTTDSCLNGACAHDPVSLDDGNACTTDACDPQTGVSHAPLVCDDADPCTADSCNPASGCTTAPIVYFVEPFADNSQGWMLETSWQIGPELANPTIPPAPLNKPDPTMDHTPTDDNGVAGVYIGGVTNQNAHAAYHLTSPVIDLSAVQTDVYLEFWRYLNTDDPAVMKSTVEVYDGSAWQLIYFNSNTVTDADWMKKQYNVTNWKNANFRVRWGWQVSPGGAFICSQWNVDDVRLIPDPSCP